MTGLPDHAQTLVELLRWRARHQSGQPAYVFLPEGEKDEERLTYAEVDRRARALGAWLQQHHLEGERGLILCPSGLDFVVSFLGCLYARAVAVPCFPPRPNRPVKRLQSIAADARARFAMVSSKTGTKWDRCLEVYPELSHLELIPVDLLDDALAETWQEDPGIESESLAFIQYTSGSTAAPRGVMVSHRNILANTAAIRRTCRSFENSAVVTWLPLFHDMGLVGHVLHALYSGVPNVILPPEAFLQRPARWLEAISRYEQVGSAAPNFAYELCLEKLPDGLPEEIRLSGWISAFNGAEQVHQETIERFARRFARNGFCESHFIPCYGLAEATLMVTAKEPPGDTPKYLRPESPPAGGAGDRQSPLSHALVSCGQPVPGTRVVIVDPNTREVLPEGAIGEIWVTGPGVAQGYWDKPADTGQLFRATLAPGDGEFFLRTGDLGFIHAADLYIAGRAKETIIFEGLNFYPQDMELTVQGCHPAIAINGCTAFAKEIEGRERIAIVAETRRGTPRSELPEIVNSIRMGVAREHGVRAHLVVLLKPFALPKTSSGKIQRGACRQMLEAGTLEILHEWLAPPSR